MKLWSKDYNEIHKNNTEWFRLSRTNRYRFTMKNSSVKFMNYFCDKYDANSVLDYGCGFGKNHFVLSDNIKIINYDPFVEQWSARPNQSADLVVCYNVLNIIEPEYVSEVLSDIYNFTNKALICNIKFPGYWGCDLNFFIKAICSKFEIKDFSYTKDKKNPKKMSLYVLSEKKQND
jgi:hypothetical protein